MGKSLFRKKKLEHISTPEELHDYMRVTNTRLWLLLGTIVALLVCAVVYASTVTMENTTPITAVISQHPLSEGEGGETEYLTKIQARLPQSMKAQVRTGMTVRMGTEDVGKVELIDLTEDENGQFLLGITPRMEYLPVPPGEYEATLVLESISPISFLWN